MDNNTPLILNYEHCRLFFTLVLCLIPYVFFRYVAVLVCVLCAIKVGRRVWKNKMLPVIEVKDRAVFITGCDSGIGFAFAKQLDKIGFTVFAGCLREKGEGAKHLVQACSKRLRVVPIDVTQQDSIDNAVVFVKKNLPKLGLWGIVNNAGINTVGEAEFTSVEIHEKGFAVNLYGPIRVTKAFLPLIRASKGRIVNVTSVRGRIDEPRQTNYAVAKHGLETVTDSLRMEMRKFAVDVAIIEPGCYGSATSIENEAMVTRKVQELEDMWNSVTPEVREGYTHDYLLSWQNKPMVHGWTAKTRDIRPVTRALEHALCSGGPKTRYLVDGFGNIVTYIDELVMLARLHNILPTWVVDGFLSWLTGCDKLS